MKKFQEPPFKQNAIALGFTLGVHVVAIVGLLFLGLSKPPEQPKKITTILVKPEDLPPPMAKPVEQETTAENQAEEILSPIVDETQPENLPVAPPPPTAQQLAAEKQKAEQAQQAKLAEQKRKAEETAKAKAEEQQKQAEAAAQKQRAEADAKAKAAEEKRKADADAKKKADADAKAKADTEAKRKTDADAKRKADADAKAKAEADTKRKADADAKAKAEADAKRKADADAKAKADAEEAKAAAAKKAEQEAAQKKAETKKIADSTKAAFKNKITRAWEVPLASRGKSINVNITLDANGNVKSVVANSSDSDLKASVEDAVKRASPLPMPDDPDIVSQLRRISITFIAQ